MADQPNRMLEFLTAPLRPQGEASRGNRRLRCRSKIQISWATPDGWKSTGARLRDISRAGACAVATVEPPLTARARVRLTEGEGTPWIEAEVIGVEVERYKKVRIRLRFLEPCPSFVLRLAVLGPVESEGGDDSPTPTPPDSSASVWVAWIQPESDEGCPNGPDRMAS